MHAGLGLSLVGPDEPRFAENVPGHGLLDVLVAGQPGQRATSRRYAPASWSQGTCTATLRPD